MLVSWKWLSQYVELSMPREELESRLSLSGLNHEGTESSADNPALDKDDFCIDLEVTSNRGDCLGHIGVAREIAVLYGLEVCRPKIDLSTSNTAVDSLLAVENQFVEACPRYTARVIQGAKIGPSPEWMKRALESVGIGIVNNVVDATNYVLMECGQPLHAFDYAKIADQKIIVRPAHEKEIITAIDHRQYELDPSMCVIADAKNASAVAGVMGGADSEVTDQTSELVVEAAVFTPLSIRRAARKLKLHSPSSYRFERRVDPAGVDWASQRVCDIITDVAGGEVASGMIDTAPELPARDPIVLRQSELERILGIKIDVDEVVRILSALGCEKQSDGDRGQTVCIPPSWRHDLTREADLIEEVARIHGYDKIPEDAPIPVAPSSRRPFDVAMERIRGILTSAGLSEAMTPSVERAQLDQSLSPWTDRPALQVQTQLLKGAKHLRRSLLPSLIQARSNNWTGASIEGNLFEIAHVYLPGETEDALPAEQYNVGIIMGGDYRNLKGIVESICRRMGIDANPTVSRIDKIGFAPGGSAELRLGDDVLGFIGVVAPKLLKKHKLPQAAVVAELSIPVLLDHAGLVPQQQAVSAFPSVQRDLNFVLNESVAWAELEHVVRAAVGDELASIDYVETYRDPKKDGKDRKRVLLSVELQRHDGTLSGQEADALIDQVIGACKSKLSAELLS